MRLTRLDLAQLDAIAGGGSRAGAVRDLIHLQYLEQLGPMAWSELVDRVRAEG